MATLERMRELPYPAIERTGVPVLPTPAGFPSLLPVEDRPDKNAGAVVLAQSRIAELEKKLASLELEIPKAKEQGRLEGEAEGRRKQTEESARLLEQSRSSVNAALEGFATERQEYFRRVEAEAVKLALAIARKVLHREAQMDPMLLRGVVRSAMDRLEQSSKAILHVPAPEVTSWRKAVAEMPAAVRPSVAADARLQAGGCVIESQMGTIELSVEAQLQEIERGFFDLLDQRLPELQATPVAARSEMKAIQ